MSGSAIATTFPERPLAASRAFAAVKSATAMWVRHWLRVNGFPYRDVYALLVVSPFASIRIVRRFLALTASMSTPAELSSQCAESSIHSVVTKQRRL